jgi:hypothetical protein
MKNDEIHSGTPHYSLVTPHSCGIGAEEFSKIKDQQ